MGSSLASGRDTTVRINGAGIKRWKRIESQIPFGISMKLTGYHTWPKH